VTVVAALLMVSRIRYNSFKGARGPKGDRVPFMGIVVALAVLIALVLDPPKLLLAAATVYALSGPVLWARRRASSQVASG
jgi:CDP-diacylglycerol--serine O-phosphatidyltransferase